MMERLIYEFLSNFSNMLIDLHFLHYDEKTIKADKKLTIGENLTIDEAVKRLKSERAWKKNKERKENIIFSYSKSNKSFDIAFIDDIQKIDSFKEKNHFLLVQTSPKKYQAYFKLDRSVNEFELYKVQKVLCYIYRGDKGALSTYQPKRLPSFFNTKYDPPFMVREVFKGNNILDVDKVLDYYKKHFEKANNINTYNRQKSKNKVNILKSWSDFSDSDLSVADMKYCCYLVRMGLNDDEIMERLLNESPDLSKRKGRYVLDYIQRTIRKARQYVY